jgi:hypothetical protein
MSQQTKWQSAPAPIHKYLNACSVRELGRYPEVADYPACGHREVTVVKYESNLFTQSVFALKPTPREILDSKS